MKNWKTMPIVHRIATVIAGLAVVVWMIHKVQPILLPIDPTYPAIAVVTACEAAFYWKEQRKWAYLLTTAAVITAACSLLELALL